MHLSLVLLVFGLISPALGSPSKAGPSFECLDKAKNKYQIFLNQYRRELRITVGKRQPESIPLTKVNFGEPSTRASVPQYYSRANPTGKTQYTSVDLSEQVRIFYSRKKKEKTEIELSIIRSEQEIPGLECRAFGFKVKVVPPGEVTPLYERLAEPIVYFGSFLDRSGKLEPLSILNIDTSIRRLASSPVMTDTKLLGKYLELIAPILKRAPPASIEIINRRLSGDDKKALEVVLKGIQYAYYPQVRRFVDWVQLGMNRTTPEGKSIPDEKAVYAGIRQFIKSDQYEQEDMKEYFRREVKKTLANIDDEMVYRIQYGLKKPQVNYIQSLLTSRKSAEAVEALETSNGIADNLIGQLRASPKKGVNRYHGAANAILAAMNSGDFKNEKISRLVGEKLGAELRKLPPKEFGVLELYFSGEQKEMLRSWAGLKAEPKKKSETKKKTRGK